MVPKALLVITVSTVPWYGTREGSIPSQSTNKIGIDMKFDTDSFADAVTVSSIIMIIVEAFIIQLPLSYLLIIMLTPSIAWGLYKGYTK